MSRRTTSARLGALAATTTLLSLGLSVGLAGSASAHVTITPSDTGAGAYTVLTFSNGHGCEGSPTTSITIDVPEEINAVTPTRNPFYDVTKNMETLDEPIQDSHGNEVTERVDTVVYTAKTPLPDGYRDAFEVQLQLPDAEGETLAFPTIQKCQQGQTDWVETPAEGQSEDDLERPAPTVTITAAGEDGHGHDDAATESSATESSSSSEATVGDTEEVADTSDSGAMWGYAGVGVGVLGLLVGGTALAQNRRKA